MKKFLILCLAIVVSILFISCSDSNPVSSQGGMPLLRENFDYYTADFVGNTPANWTRASVFSASDAVYFPVTNTASVSADKSIMIYSQKKDYDRQIIKALITSPPVYNAGTIKVNFNVNVSFLMSGRAFVFYLQQVEKMRLDFDFGGTTSYYSAGNTAHTPGINWTAGDWYNVTMTLDLTADTYSWTIEKDDIIAGVIDIPCNDLHEQKADATIISAVDAVYTDFFGILTNMGLSFADYSMYIDDIYITYK